MKIAPKNWHEFQHYKDRCPPWVRLHRKLLDDRDFHRLPDASRALAPMLWLLASESMDGEINAAVDELAFRLRRTEKEIGAALKPLIDNGFFVLVQDDSDLLAESERSAVPEATTETEAEQKNLTVLVDRAKAVPYKVPPCPYDDIAKAYAELLPSLPQLAVLSDARKAPMRERWRQVCAAERFTVAEGVEWFRWYFGHVAESPFLMGQGKPRRDSGKPWMADFDWLMTASKFARVVEGRYHGKAAA